MDQTIFDNENHAYTTFLWVWSNHNEGFAPGGFAECLINAFIRADGDNFNRLSEVYPAYAKAYNKIVKKQ